MFPPRVRRRSRTRASSIAAGAAPGRARTAASPSTRSTSCTTHARGDASGFSVSTGPLPGSGGPIRYFALPSARADGRSATRTIFCVPPVRPSNCSAPSQSPKSNGTAGREHRRVPVFPADFGCAEPHQSGRIGESIQMRPSELDVDPIHSGHVAEFPHREQDDANACRAHRDRLPPPRFEQRRQKQRG